MVRVLSSALFAIVSCVAFAGCRGAHPGCGPDGHPPERTVPGALLFQRSDPACPKSEPTGGACSLPRVPASDSSGQPVEVFVTCHYAAPKRGPCEYDGCTCKRAAPNDPPVWSCGEVME